MNGVSKPRVMIVSSLPCCISLGWIGRSSVLRSTHLQKRQIFNISTFEIYENSLSFKVSEVNTITRLHRFRDENIGVGGKNSVPLGRFLLDCSR